MLIWLIKWWLLLGWRIGRKCMKQPHSPVAPCRGTLVYDAECRNSLATYKVFSAPINNFTTEFTAMVTSRGRNPQESETTFFGWGSGPMALREAAYIAIAQLAIHFPAIRYQYEHVNSFSTASSEVNSNTAGSSSASDGRIHRLLGPWARGTLQ
jgi:hypothetical protein